MTSNKTLMVILSSPKDNELLKEHWKYFKLAGADEIAGLGTEDNRCEWPEQNILVLNTGKVGLKHVGFGTAIWGLLNAELDALKAFLQTDYDSCLIMEPDNLVLRKFPKHPGGCVLTTMVPNYHGALFAQPVYFVTPRWYDRLCAAHWVHHAEQMIAAGDVQHWMSDRFASHVCHKGGIPFQHLPSFTAFPFPWMGKTVQESFIQGCRAAIATGAYCLHGVKDGETRERVLEGFKI